MAGEIQGPSSGNLIKQSFYQFKHFYQKDLVGSGSYQFRQFTPTALPAKLATPTNVTVDGTTVSWDEVTNATSYDIYVSGVEGVYETISEPAAYDDCITFTGENSEFTLSIGTGGAKEWDGTVWYSTDHNTWTVWNGTSISSVDKKLYLRGKNNTKFYTSKGARLRLSARAACSGNIQTLIEYSNPPTEVAKNCYRYMFYNCTSLTQAPTLPATTLAEWCYPFMFGSCTSLTQAPTLPATTLAKNCYSSMFYNCTSLTQAPALPATTLADSCYEYMFDSCTSLTQAPALPATTLAEWCYTFMFDSCTSLTQAPALPATTLAKNCYASMFYGCTSLTTAPALPATTLAVVCYASMFYGCTSLTTAPALPATTLASYCYANMFNGCTSLTQAPTLPATTLADSCYSGMFDGCTSLTTAPALPATTLEEWCYTFMFGSCTSLTQAPTLPATTLASHCYEYMFDGCTSLKISETQSTEYPTAWRIPSSGTISSAALAWNTGMLSGTGGTFTSDPNINTTYYGAWTK